MLLSLKRLFQLNAQNHYTRSLVHFLKNCQNGGIFIGLADFCPNSTWYLNSQGCLKWTFDVIFVLLGANIMSHIFSLGIRGNCLRFAASKWEEGIPFYVVLVL